MKELFKNAIKSLRKKEDESLFKNFISDYSSREERHYCAYLFSWLINEPGAIELFFKNHSSVHNKTNSRKNDNIPDLSKIEYKNAKVYYEYTAIREVLDLIERKVKTINGPGVKSG